MGTTKVRESGIELLRIIIICGVVLMHYGNPVMGAGLTYVSKNSINETVIYLLDGFFICAVNTFLLISGYFLCATEKRSLSKAVGLLTQVSVFRVADLLIDCAGGGGQLFDLWFAWGCFTYKLFCCDVCCALFNLSIYQFAVSKA